MPKNNNGFEEMADFLGRVSRVDPKKVSLESLEEAANYFAEKLIPNIPRSLRKKEHMAEHVKVVVEKEKVKVVFDDVAYYWRFVENGRRDRKAQHFVKGTYEQHKEQIEKIMTKKILDALEG